MSGMLRPDTYVVLKNGQETEDIEGSEIITKVWKRMPPELIRIIESYVYPEIKYNSFISTLSWDYWENEVYDCIGETSSCYGWMHASEQILDKIRDVNINHFMSYDFRKNVKICMSDWFYMDFDYVHYVSEDGRKIRRKLWGFEDDACDYDKLVIEIVDILMEFDRWYNSQYSASPEDTQLLSGILEVYNNIVYLKNERLKRNELDTEKENQYMRDDENVSDWEPDT